MHQILQIYKTLLKSYGRQGWWPLLDCKGCNPTKTGSIRGYHPGDYSYPKTDAQRFEICLGAILTQNTAWTNVEKALGNLRKARMLSKTAVRNASLAQLAGPIQPSGYYNQKAKKLQALVAFLDSGKEMTRENLLAVWGIGPETADSILLYAYRQPVFVIDAYTKRIFSRYGLAQKDGSYDALQLSFQTALPHDWKLFNEFHALLVEHGKRVCATRPECHACHLTGCKRLIDHNKVYKARRLL